MARILALNKQSVRIFVILFFAVALLPIIVMMVGAFVADGIFPRENVLTLLAGFINFRLLANSLSLSLLTSVFALICGLPAGFLLSKTDLPLKNFFRVVLMVPLFLPPYLLSISWTHILGKQGVLAFLLPVGDFSSAFLFSLPGAAFVLGNTYYPLVMFISMAGFFGIDSSFEDEGLLNTNKVGLFRAVHLPFISSFLKAALLLIFILSLSEFGVPSFLGTSVYTVEILTQFSAFYDFQSATSHTIVLVVIAFLMVVISRKLLAKVSSEISETLTLGDHRIFKLGKLRWLFFGLMTVFFIIFVGMPIGILIVKSFPLQTYLQAFRLAGNSILHSLFWASIGATAIILFGFVFGYARERLGWQFVDSMTLFSFVIPGTVLGIGLIVLWNRGFPFYLIYNSILMVLFGYIARFTYLGENIIFAAVRQIPVSFEEAAILEGGSWFTILRKIILPLSRPALITAWILGFVFSFGELSSTLLVYPPGNSTLPIKIFTISANSPESLSAALCVVMLGIILGFVGGLFRIFISEW